MIQINKELGLDILEKVEKVLSKKVYLYNADAKYLNQGGVKIDVMALHAIQEDAEVTEKKDGYFYTCVPLKYEERVIGAVCAGDRKKEKAQEFANLAKGLAEALLYEEFLVRNIYIANDLRSDFIKEILTGSRIKTTEEAIDQGDIIGINLRFKYAVMVFKIKDLYEDYISKRKKLTPEAARTKFLEHLKEIENMLLCAFEDEIQNCIVYIGGGKFVMLKEIKEENINTINSVKVLKKSGNRIYKALNEKFSDKVSVGVGQYYPGLAGLRKSFEDANIALKLGEKVIRPERVYHILDVAMFVGLLSGISNSRKNELSFQVLQKLYNDKDLLKTTSMFLESGMNLTEAAKKLHLHRNTLIYRLNKVKNLIGLDPTRFHDALQIKLGLMVHAEQEAAVGVN